MRAARRNGETFYNLAEQKRIIAKFKPPWVMRRPKRRGPDTFEGRKIVMRGDSKKTKKKKGPAMMNEMLAKAAQVNIFFFLLSFFPMNVMLEKPVK